MMNFIKEIFLQNAFSSLKLSAVILLLFTLTKPITKRYTAGFRYYSWLAVMLIFFIPFARLGINCTIDVSPAVTSGIHNIQTYYEEKAPEYSVTEEYTGYDRIETADGEKAEYVPVIKTATAKKKVDIAAISAVIWLIGAALYFALHYGRYIYFKRGLKRLSDPVTDERIAECLNSEKERLGIGKPLKISCFTLIDTPMLVGLIKPQIILPRLDYTQDELRLILRHELFHLKRRDILYQFVTLVFVSLHWFNPIVHLMAKAIEFDGETSCDEKTLEGKAYEEKIFYGEMLIKFLKTKTQKRSYMTTTFYGGKNAMKKRLTLIADKTARRKGTAAMAAVMTIAAMLSLSAAAMGNDYFNSVFEGDVSYLADFVKTEKKSIEDDRFKLTLEQRLVAEKQAMLICSFEAKTEDAKQEMNAVDEKGHSTFSGMDFLNFVPTDYEKANIGGASLGSLGDGKFDTETKKYYVLQSESIRNEECVDFRLSTDRIEGKQPIIVPMDYNMETKTVEFDGIKAEYNPISISLTYPVTGRTNDCDWCSWYGNYFFFRMKNGEIKTFNQLYESSSWDSDYDGQDRLTAATTHAWARGIIEPDEIKSIIIDDTEYPVDDPSKSKPITIDEHMKPFIIDAYVQDHLWVPLRAFCEGLGAEIKWDSDTQTASFNYRGSSYSFTVGRTGIVINGEECDFGSEAPFIDEQGRMIVPPRFNGYNNHTYIAVDMHRMVIGDDENGGSNPDVKWHIIP